MSLNKVLNRPLFRQKALKKGYLTPIRAQLGTMVGPTMDVSTGPQRFPMINVPQPKPLSMTRRFFNTVGRGVRGAFGLPFLLGSGVTYGALDRSDPEGNLPESVKLGLSGLGGAAATRLPGAAALGSMGIGPQAVLFGTGALIQNRIAAGRKELERIKKMSPEERKRFEIEQRNKAFNYFDGGVTDQELFGADADKVKFVSPATEVRQQVSTKGKKGGGRLNVDRLTEPENESKIAKGTVDIDKVIKNNIDEGDLAIDEMKIEPPKSPTEIKTAKKEEEKKTETVGATTSEQANKQLVKNQTDNAQAGKIKSGDGSEVTSDVIVRARQIRNELMAGQGSQAKTVFLANLASGLLTGTTTKSGLGGALEVFGQALGPAVNNYATIKLKENELENEFMADALDIAFDELKAKNAAIEAPDYPDATAGVVRMLDRNGNPINVTARQLKDSTVQIAFPGQVDDFGRQVFVTVTPDQYISFRTQKGAEKGQMETLRDLSAKYKAYQLGTNTINIIEQAIKEDKKFAGPAGRFNLFTTRLGDALSDFGFNISSIEDAERTASDLRSKLAQGLVNSGEAEDLKAAEKILDKQFGSTLSLKDKIEKQLGTFADQTDSANLERLAINETVMVYALANSLKSKDRLTQKDIQMAKELVNVFPLLRGQRTVAKSLRAVNETILSDIRRLENDYQDIYLGDTHTVNQYRRKYGLITGEQQMAVPGLENPFAETETEDLFKQLEGI